MAADNRRLNVTAIRQYIFFIQNDARKPDSDLVDSDMLSAQPDPLPVHEKVGETLSPAKALAPAVHEENGSGTEEPVPKKARLDFDPAAEIQLLPRDAMPPNTTTITQVKLESPQNPIQPDSKSNPDEVIDLESADEVAPSHTESSNINSPSQVQSMKTESFGASDKPTDTLNDYTDPSPMIYHVPTGQDPARKFRLPSDFSRGSDELSLSLYLSLPVNDRSDQSSIVRAIAENSATIANLDRGLSSNGLRTTTLLASPYGLSPSLPLPALAQGSLPSKSTTETSSNGVSGYISESATPGAPLKRAGTDHNAPNVLARNLDRLVLIYDKPRYYHTIMHLNQLRNNLHENVRIVELVNSESIVSDPTLARTNFDSINICIEYTSDFHSYLQKFIDFFSIHAAKIKAIPQVSYHFHLSPDRKWPSEYTQEERDSYVKFSDALAQVAGDHVVQCSIINKYDMATVYITDPKELARIGREIQQDIAPWKNLRVLDYVESSIRFLPKIEFPPTLEVLNIGGGYALETLTGFVMPPRLQMLIASQGAILSIDNVVFPSTLKRLELSDNRIYFVTYADFPQLLEHLDLSLNRIESLRGVNFPRNLKTLDLGFNPIDSFKGVRFPEGLEALDLTNLPNESMSGVKFPDLLKILNLQGSMTSTRGLKLPPHLIDVTLCGNGVNSINPLKLPNTIEVLYLNDNNIKTLNKVNFPPRLRELYLGDNLITTLKNVMFPPTLQVLDFDMDPNLDDNEKSISSLKDVLLPPGIRVLKFKYHSFKNIESFEFPPYLVTLSFANNGLRSIRDVKFGNKLKTLDLSGNPELTNIDHLDLPESVTELKIPHELANNLPAYIVERANRKQLVLVKSRGPEPGSNP